VISFFEIYDFVICRHKCARQYQPRSIFSNGLKYELHIAVDSGSFFAAILYISIHFCGWEVNHYEYEIVAIATDYNVGLPSRKIIIL